MLSSVIFFQEAEQQNYPNLQGQVEKNQTQFYAKTKQKADKIFGGSS